MPQQRRRWRDRWFPLATLVVAVFWAFTAWQQAPELKQANAARLLGSLFVGGMGLGSTTAHGVAASEPQPMSSLLPSFSLLTSGTRPAERVAAPSKRSQSPFSGLHRSMRTVETVVYVWERMMYGIAVLLATLAVASLATGRTRLTHLIAAAVMLAGTTATLVGMRIVEHPSAGDMPPLPRYQYVLAGAVLSAYAWVLLVAFVRSGRRPHVEASGQ